MNMKLTDYIVGKLLLPLSWILKKLYNVHYYMSNKHIFFIKKIKPLHMLDVGTCQDSSRNNLS